MLFVFAKLFGMIIVHYVTLWQIWHKSVDPLITLLLLSETLFFFFQGSQKEINSPTFFSLARGLLESIFYLIVLHDVAKVLVGQRNQSNFSLTLCG